MNAGNGHTHAADIHDEAAVSVYTDDIAFQTGKETGGDA